MPPREAPAAGAPSRRQKAPTAAVEPARNSPRIPPSSEQQRAAAAPSEKSVAARASRKGDITEPTGLPQVLQRNDLDIDERKRMFIDTALPLVVAENDVVKARRKAMRRLFHDLEQGKALGEREQKWLHRLAEVYEVDGDPVVDKETRALLRRRVDVIPADLALAQAANESGWGRSRFAHKGHNLFGLWTYETGKGLVPKLRANGKSHLVRKFDSLRESVAEYMHHLNTKGAYKEFRLIRAKLRSNGEPLDGIRLAQGLRRYSELGTEYVRRIRSLIRSNDLGRLSLEMESDSVSQGSPS